MTSNGRPDIVVMEFDKPFDLYFNVAPASLPTKVNNPDIICNISGWGSIVHASHWHIENKPEKYVKKSDDLKIAEVRLMKDESCESEYHLNWEVRNFLKKYEICTAKLTGTVCKGDSGGPLVCKGMISFFTTDNSTLLTAQLKPTQANMLHIMPKTLGLASVNFTFLCVLTES